MSLLERGTRLKPCCQARNPKKRGFGPGTVVTLAGALVVIVIGVNSRPAKSSSIEDAKVRLAAEPKRNLPPLKKPEPGDLLKEGLSGQKAEKIHLIDVQWQARKKVLLARMAEIQSLPSGKQVLDHAGEYSRLSTEYNAAREEAWKQAQEAVR